MPTIEREETFERLAQAVDAALEEVRKINETDRERAGRLKEALEDLHRHVLVKIVRRLKEDPRGREILFELVEDQAVYAAFLMHGIVKPDLTTRVARVIELVRPYMKSHGGDVELVRVEGDTAFVRLHGSCNGCSLSSVTLRNGVEEALREHVPEIRNVEVAPNEPGPAFIPLSEVDTLEDTGWVAGPRLEELASGEPCRLEGQDFDVLIIQIDGKIYAYKNACAHMGMPLDGGMIEDEVLTCPWHGFRFDLTSGECLTVPQAQLEPYPLRVDDGVVWVRPSHD
ncbi:NifU family protein [Rhodocaloribacter sp.]